MANKKNTLYARRINPETCGELNEKTVNIARTAKVVKGGRRFGFSALVVTGDGRGNVGFGLGKASEVPDALRKGAESAKKNMIRVPIKGATIPHDVVGCFGPTKVVMKPAAPGTGVIAGLAVRALIEGAGIKDVRTKILGSSNPANVLEATFNGLLALKNPAQVSGARGIDPDSLGYQPY
jgi:small subunit ribosomal protein S5